MRVETFRYDLGSGRWSIEQPPALDSERTLVLAFGATELQSKPEVFKVLRSYYPNSHLLGCSTAGEILDGELTDGTLSIAVMQFDQTALASEAVVVRQPEQSLDAGRDLGRRLLREEPLAGVILLTEGLRIDHRALIRGVQSEIGEHVPVIGALAADSRHFERTWVWLGDRIQSGLCAAVGLYGTQLVVQAATTEDWGSQSANEHTVTKSDHKVVYQLDGRPALEIMRASGGGELRLLRVPREDGWALIPPLAVDEEHKGVVFQEPVPEGSRVEVLDGNRQSLIEAASSAAGNLSPSAKALTQAGAQSVALATSCIGRRIFLGDQAQEEIGMLSNSLAADTRILGLYSYGDVSPANGQPSALHESALSVVLLAENPSVQSTHTTAGPPPPPDRSGPTASDVYADAYGSGTSATGSGSGSQSLPYSGSGSLRQVRPKSLDLGAASATVYYLNDLRFAALTGTLNESFNFRSLAGELQGRVVLDLAGIEHITSFGVRGWLEMMNATENHVSALYLANLSEAVVNQMLMVRNFAGKGQIVSFGAPYICTACSNSFEFLLDCQHAADEIRNASPPDVACSECGNRAVFDDDPTTFFEFVDEDLGKELPNDVRNALAERRLEWMTHVEESIEKRIEGERTVFHINRKVDEKIRWRRVLTGVEGTVQLDFTRAKGATPTGAERLLAALRVASDAVKVILLDQVPMQIVEKLVGSEPVPKLRVRTLAVPARCANCGVVRVASIDPAGIRDAKRQGLQPESECRRCSGSIPITLPPEIVAYFEGSDVAAAKAAGGASIGLGGMSPRTILLVAGAIVATVTIAIVVMRLL